MRKLGDAYSASTPAARLEFRGGANSGGAIRGVLEGTLDIAVTNRPLSAVETSEPLSYFPVVRDAVAFAVHSSVQLARLTSADICALYGGRITNWRELGGADSPVIVLDRDPDESMRKLVLLPLLGEQAVVNTAVMLTSASDMLTSLDSSPGALGYTSLGLLRLATPKNVTAVSLDGVMPHPEAVAAGRYPWSLTFGLVTRSEAPPPVREFVQYAVQSARTVLGPFEYEPLDA
jgi:phosphate transport system substrate-binding protein